MVQLAAHHVRRRARVLAACCVGGTLPHGYWPDLFPSRPPSLDDLPRAVAIAWEAVAATKPPPLCRTPLRARAPPASVADRSCQGWGLKSSGYVTVTVPPPAG